ncbi:3-oxoacyl-ACP synthase [Fructilactobacillus lindneri]|uniref:Beta-ketoacyl-[acyl-carrier-protein] synthase III n=2 Tax=Fructilactobacillus lindneri TaxID=53444 RepID=A0A0R2JNR2_9LACO|nr:beta-ketoacyl-ACP synthase III [Fructilactobacillus lindneri]ANZ57800.1 3-oxoacyl-ACP synthase [Fructilactobacillus lindneri]ANZ59069.1 3-oxoacyl-ACP synthase [Fructilactobacillus lindneri]KRN78753.1 3-oxoacyl-ACP synthase [Fructilactobacillus lindneri DSM 20690 = JCM 11027]POG98123.1 3-oxoacyl-ACP synthase [Fructilactobacillus lindneri]POH01762.1 3-oxoacyl-ACP synthase [Fructilactobacillus lindneri]
MGSFAIKAVAKSVPQKIVTNDDLTKVLDTSDEWIKRRTGISQRHIAVNESNTEMGVKVANQLLEKSGIDADELNFIIVATMSSDYQTPSTAASIQGIIGAQNAMAFDINAACSGFVYGSTVLNALLAGNPGGKGIIIGEEKLSKLVDWHDRSTAVLFGDGAAGMLVENDGSSSQILAEDLKTYGQLGSSLTAGHFPEDTPFGSNEKQVSQYFKMDGHLVYNFATTKAPASIQRALDQAGLQADQIKFFVMHQANERIVKRVAKKLSLSMDKFPLNISDYGNTAAASEPLLLSELVDKGKIKRGDYLALTGFGGGLTVGTMIIRY